MLAARVWKHIRAGYHARRYGYQVEGAGAATAIAGLLAYLHPPRRADLDASALYLDAVPDGRLLEVGCGAGKTLAYLQSLGWRAVGTDLDGEAVAVAASLGVDARHGALEALAFPANNFDAVVVKHVIEHLPDPRATLREIRRILKPGGTLIVLTPNAAGRGHARFGKHWRGLEPPRHLHIFTPGSLELLITEVGFSIRKAACTGRARSIEVESLRIRQNRAGTKRLLDTLYGGVSEWMEWITLQFRPKAGNELLVIASRE
jgi:SAM-dependent methyltransferase